MSPTPPPEDAAGREPAPDDAPLIVEELGEGLVLVRCRSRFLVDSGAIATFKAGLQEVADRLPPGSGVIVSLAGIEHLASGALLALILFRRRVRDDRGGVVETCEAMPWVAESFRLIAGFAWAPYPSLAQAVEAVRKALREAADGGPPADPAS